jgi:hypothetical protein
LKNVKLLKEKLAQLEEVDEGKEIYLSKPYDTQLKVEFSQPREKILSLQSKVERLENLMKEQMEEDEEDIQCLI